MRLIIREAIKSDFINIKAMVIEVHKLHVENRPDVYLDIDKPLDERDFYELVNSNYRKVFVVEDTITRELLAYSIVRIILNDNSKILVHKKVVFIDEFCVKSNFRRQGIGKMLFNYIVKYSEKEGASSLQLAVWEFNREAIIFYDSLGMMTSNRKMELIL